MNAYLVSALIILQLMDGTVTTWAIKHGAREANPLMQPLAGNWLFPVLKVLIVVIILLIAARRVVKQPSITRRLNIEMACLGVVYAVVVARNIYLLS